jgi:hypothetical protein
MNAKEAAKVAIGEVAAVFADQAVRGHVRLEEFERVGAQWLVTVSFQRVRDVKGPNEAVNKAVAHMFSDEWSREYKVVTIDDDGGVAAIRNYRSKVA